MHLAPFVTEILGFTKSNFFSAGVYTSEHIVDIDPVIAIYIYCDVIKHRILVHTLAPLLRVISVSKASLKPALAKDMTNYITILC